MSTPNFPSALDSDRSDLKLSWSLNDSQLMDLKLHYEDYNFPSGDAFATPSASAVEFGTNPAWGLRYQAVLNANQTIEAHYAGYTGEDFWHSQTESTEPPFIDYTNNPETYSGGLWYPYDYELSRDQVDVKMTQHADGLITGEHDFKFGISYGQGENDTIITSGANGTYYYKYEYYAGYPYYYKVEARPYHYGAESDSWAAFVDDAWRINDKLTLNVGVRFDQHGGDIPSYDRLDQQSRPTGEKIPGINNVVDWSLVSPRIGFAYQTSDKGVLRGFYGKFYDANVTGNWDAPPVDAPSYVYSFSANRNGPYEVFSVFEQDGTNINPDLDAPETDQITFGYEHQLSRYMAVGIQGILKDTKNLIGWEILDDGVYEFQEFTNPVDGSPLLLANVIEQPTLRKGNRPGPGAVGLPPDAEYEQDYEGLVLTFTKRHSNGWSLNSSYTWSDSEGLTPRPLGQTQNGPFYASREGSDPNNWINARQALQGDREHMFQLQSTFELPWQLTGSVVYNYLDGRPYSRQARFPLAHGGTRVIVRPASKDLRLPSQSVIDLALGRKFQVADTQLRFDIQVLNATNEDDHDFWRTLNVPAGSQFTPTAFIFPRRVMLRLGIEF